MDVWVYGVWEHECFCVVQIKPMLAIWRVERETKEKQAEIDKLKTKVEKLEGERDALQESENLLSEKVEEHTHHAHVAYMDVSQYMSVPVYECIGMGCQFLSSHAHCSPTVLLIF